MLTTDNAKQVRENIVTDVNANVESPTAPAPRYLSPEAEILLNKSIIARPLMVPEVCSIKVKNLDYRYRWVNKAGRGGAIYMQRKAQGFTNATTDDVEIMAGDAVANQGEITAGDVILMKIRRDLYDAAMKYNMQKAAVLQRTRGMYLSGASSDINTDGVAERVTVKQEPFSHTGKADSFIPDNPNALIAGAKGTIGEARAQVQDIRDNIAKDSESKAKK